MLDQHCALALDLKLMLLARMRKILLQQYRHEADLPACPLFCRFWELSGHGRFMFVERWQRDQAFGSESRVPGVALANVKPEDFGVKDEAGARASPELPTPNPKPDVPTPPRERTHPRGRLGQAGRSARHPITADLMCSSCCLLPPGVSSFRCGPRFARPALPHALGQRHVGACLP